MGRGRAATIGALAALVLGFGWWLADRGVDGVAPLAPNTAPRSEVPLAAGVHASPRPDARPLQLPPIDALVDSQRALDVEPRFDLSGDGPIVEWERAVQSCEAADVTTRVTVFADGRLARHVQRGDDTQQLVGSRQLDEGDLEQLLRELQATGVLGWSGRLPDPLLDSDDGSHSVTALSVRLMGRRVAAEGRDVAARAARLRAPRPAWPPAVTTAEAATGTHAAGLPMTDCSAMAPPVSATPGRLQALADAEELVWRLAQSGS